MTTAHNNIFCVYCFENKYISITKWIHGSDHEESGIFLAYSYMNGIDIYCILTYTVTQYL